MEEESKTKFSMNVEFSFSFKDCRDCQGKGLASVDFLWYNIRVAKKHVCGEPQWCRKSADGFGE